MTCIYIAIVLLILPYVLGPVFVKLTHKVNPDPVVTPVTTDAMSQELRQFFNKHIAGLQTLDYTPVAQFLIADYTPGTAAYVWLWQNDKERMIAAIHGTFSAQGDSPLAKLPGGNRSAQYVEFLTQFDSGLVVVTNNSPALSSSRDMPQRDVVQVPGVESAAVLHRVHAVRVARLKPAGSAAVMPPPGLEMQWFKKLLTDEAEGLVRTGTYERDESGGLRPTWPASITIALSHLPPYRQILGFRRNERAEKELAAARGK
jgi:hypothetical protein